MAWRQCHIVAFEGRASFPLWARPGQPTAPRRRRNAQGQILLERGILSYSQVLNFWYDAVRQAIQQAGAIAWDQFPPAGGIGWDSIPHVGAMARGQPPPTGTQTPSGAVHADEWPRRSEEPSRHCVPSQSVESPRLSGFTSTLESSTPSVKSPTPLAQPPNQQGDLLTQWVVYWSYYAQNHWRRAVRDILQRATRSGAAEQLTCPKGPDSPSCRCLVLLGFSNGGDAVYQTAKALGGQGIRVDLAITVDPVRKPLRGMGFMGFRRPDNVARWINYYQRFDRRTLAGLLPIVGRHVDGADENHQLGPEDFPDPKTRPKAHVWIPSLEQIRLRIRDEIVALLRRPGYG